MSNSYFIVKEKWEVNDVDDFFTSWNSPKCHSRKSLKLGLHISRKDRKRMVANMYFKLYRYELVSLSLQWQVVIFHKKLFQSIFWQL